MIKIVCAWCGKVMKEGAEGVELVSHLICPQCYEREMGRLKARKPLFGQKTPPPEPPSPPLYPS